jgi:hypothetical protein
MYVRQTRPPGRGDCWILKIAHAASHKNLFKNGFGPRKGSLSGKAFLQKNFQVREKIPLSALAFGCSHALVAEGFKEPSAHRSSCMHNTSHHIRTIPLTTASRHRNGNARRLRRRCSPAFQVVALAIGAILGPDLDRHGDDEGLHGKRYRGGSTNRGMGIPHSDHIVGGNAGRTSRARSRSANLAKSS